MPVVSDSPRTIRRNLYHLEKHHLLGRERLVALVPETNPFHNHSLFSRWHSVNILGNRSNPSMARAFQSADRPWIGVLRHLDQSLEREG